MIKNLEDLVEAAKSRPSGDRESVLDSETRAKLDEFVAFLQDEGKTQATARSYRSYMVTALISDKDWDELTSDVRSAVRAFARFSG